MSYAGYGASECVEQLDLEAHKALFDTNYFGMVSLCSSLSDFLALLLLPGL